MIRSNVTSSILLSFALLASLIVGAMGATPVYAAGPLCYVNQSASGANNGTSWENAYLDLQAAIADTNCTEIWVAAGTYKPASGTDRTISFALRNGLGLYGGFDGTEMTRDQRNPAANITVLSGDIDNNDSQIPIITDLTTATGNTTNSYHVVIGATGATLDGFTITAGNANGNIGSSTSKGAGLYNISSSPTLANVTFSGNSAYDGGGMYNSLSSSQLTNVTFSGNSATRFGGGMDSDGGGQTLTNVTFSGNLANFGGGGMANEGGSLTLTNVIFVNNVSHMGGGLSNSGDYYEGDDRVTLTNVTFSGNSANDGGGMSNQGNNRLTLTNVAFSGNTATDGNGGGMWNYYGAPTLINVTFSDNTAERFDEINGGDGGGMWSQGNYPDTDPTLINVTFSNNVATDNGGGMFNFADSSPTLTSVTFSGNSADSGGGMFNEGDPTLKNVILWGNTALDRPEIYNNNSAPVISYSIVQGSGGSAVWDASFGTDGGNNIDLDPRLGALGNYGGFTQTIPLLAGSAAINTGDDTVCPTTDQRGVARDANCDIGAFEFKYEGEVRYAVPSGGMTSGQCGSWVNACDLQTAIATAVSGDEIWVAAGSYTPHESDRTISFELKSGVGLYGGFAGTETARDQRDSAANVTILSGDLLGDDADNVAHNEPSRAENSYHVVVGSSTDNTAALDGFTVTGGNANGGYADPYNQGCGGGMYNLDSNAMLTNVTFAKNTSTRDGGGMHNWGGNPSLTDVAFTENSADNGGGMSSWRSSPSLTDVAFTENSADKGGGMYNEGTGSPTLTGVTFVGNYAAEGGGMANEGGGLTLTNVTFVNNVARIMGGGLSNSGDYFEGPNRVTLTNVTFSGNSAQDGGGMSNWGNNRLTLTNVAFSGNTAVDGDGGGMWNFEGAPTLTNVTFSDNTAEKADGIWDGNGGGMWSQGDYPMGPTLINVTFSNNVATDYGGGMFNSWGGTLTSVTFSGNSAHTGGGMASGEDSTLKNVILWGNTAFDRPEIYSNTTVVISYSIVQGSGGSAAWDASFGTDGGNNLDLDPRLGALGNYGGFTQTVPLLAGSAAINTGDDTVCPTADQRGVARPQGTHCDIGAYEVEVELTSIYYAKPVATGTADCSTWANACTLQSALTIAVSGDEIWVAAGIHKPGAGGNREATFQLKNGVAVYGGFAGTETAREQRDFDANATILSGDLAEDDAGFINNTENAYHVVTGATGATLDGFIITAGNANGDSNGPNECGAGMYNASSSPILANVILTGNVASYSGAGMQNWNESNPTLMNVIFSGNSTGLGGGMNNENMSNPTLINVTFSGNSAIYGGGMNNENASNPTLINVTFSGNSAYSSGGGMANFDGSNPVLTNVTFRGNSAGSNSAGGGGMYNNSSNPTIRNTIIWGNTPDNEWTPQIFNYFGSTPVVNDSVIQGGYIGGTNIITTDPRLGALGNYGGFTQTIPILAGSSAIDAGNDTVCPATDQRGVARPQGAHCDIGAYETVDPTSPIVTAFTAASPSNSLNIPITAFTATDNVAVTGYLITESATVPGAGAAGWTGSAPATYTVAGNGSYNLYPWAKDAVGNVSAVFVAPVSVSVDSASPGVVSIIRVGANPTSAVNIGFIVTFSEAVSGVNAADFGLTATGSISNAAVTGISGSGSIYTVTVSTGTGSGTLRLDVAAASDIEDLAGNPLGGRPYTGGESYVIAKGPIPSTWIGGVSIASDQSVVAVARPHLGSEVASYIGSSAGSTTQYVPMLFKGAFGGTYNAALYIQNASASSASLTLEFTNDSGTVIYTKTDTLDPHASKGYWLPAETGLPAGFAGGVKVTSTQPILAVGRPHIGTQVMTYNGMSSGATTAWLPMFFKNGFGSYNTALYVQNVTGSSANLTIEYINLDGTVACTDNDTLGANASRGYWSLAITCDTGSLPSGFVGGVKVTSTQDILAVARAHLGTQITTYNGSAAGATSAYLPMLFKNAFSGGSYDAALYLQNVSGSSADVTIEYLNSAGAVAATQNVTLAANAISSIWLPGVVGLADGFAGGARISSTQNVIAIGRPHLGSEITAYNGAPEGSLNAYLPMLFKNAYGGGYDAAFYVQNTSGSAANVEISFYDSAGVLSCVKSINLAAGATEGFWIPTVTCEP